MTLSDETRVESGITVSVTLTVGTGGSTDEMYAVQSINQINQIKFYLVTHNTYYVHFITSVVTEEIP